MALGDGSSSTQKDEARQAARPDPPWVTAKNYFEVRGTLPLEDGFPWRPLAFDGGEFDTFRPLPSESA
jgi:hypothetical protein